MKLAWRKGFGTGAGDGKECFGRSKEVCVYHGKVPRFRSSPHIFLRGDKG